MTAKLQEAALGNNKGVAAAAVTTQFMTIAVVAVADPSAACHATTQAGNGLACKFGVFDSHSYDYGDGKPDGATFLTFTSGQQLQDFLCERFAMVSCYNCRVPWCGRGQFKADCWHGSAQLHIGLSG